MNDKLTHAEPTLAAHWSLDPAVTFLNHGSFGACPRIVLEKQAALRAEMEREPVAFLVRHMQARLDDSREALAQLLDADVDDLAFVANATTGVNAVLRSLEWQAGDELLVTDHAYNACRAALDYVADRAGVNVIVATLPFPLRSDVEWEDEVVDAVLRCVTPGTKLAMIDHVTSVTGLLLPIDRIVRRLAERGVDTLVDGAHAPGMVPLSLRSLDAAYYTGNCHKWLCAPKGAGFLWVRRDKQKDIVPAVISHGHNAPRPGRSRFHDLFDWPGTIDPTPWLCVKDAITFVESLLPGGLGELMSHNRKLALRGRDILCDALGIAPPAPDAMIGSLAALPLPDDFVPSGRFDLTTVPTPTALLQTQLYERYQIEVPVNYWPAPPRRVIRISAQAYNSIEQFEHLAEALRTLLDEEGMK